MRDLALHGALLGGIRNHQQSPARNVMLIAPRDAAHFDLYLCSVFSERALWFSRSCLNVHVRFQTEIDWQRVMQHLRFGPLEDMLGAAAPELHAAGFVCRDDSKRRGV